MHELGMCEAVVEAICRRAGGRPVSWAQVRVGGHPVDPEVISQGVAMAAMGTEAQGLLVDVVLDPLRARCRRCGADEPVDDALGLAACRSCGGVDIELVGAEHVVLQALAYREAEKGEETWTPSSS